MQRRTLIMGLCGAVASPLTSRAAGIPRLAVLFPGSRRVLEGPYLSNLAAGLALQGFRAGQVEIAIHTTEGDPARNGPMVAEALAESPAAILAIARPALLAAHAATRTVPIVAYDLETDPIAEGLAQSLTRPASNVTGVFLEFSNFAGKLIELLIEATGKLSRLGVIWDPATGPVQLDTVRKAAGAFRLELDVRETSVAADFGPAFAGAHQSGADAIVMLTSPLIPSNAETLAELSLHHRLPVVTFFTQFPRAGGLMSYGPDFNAMYRQSGNLAGKLLRGASVSGVPIERPAKFELIVNQRAARALGLTIPPSILARADEVIE